MLDFSHYMAETLGEIYYERTKAKIVPPVSQTQLERAVAKLHPLQSKHPILPQNRPADAALCISIAQHQLEVQLFFMVLYCHILRATSSETSWSVTEEQLPPMKAAVKNHHKEMLTCVRAIADTFDYIHSLNPSRSMSCLPHCFGVYCAAVILGVAQLRREVDLDTDIVRIERALKAIQSLPATSENPDIAKAAICSLKKILRGIRELKNGAQPKTRAGDTSSVNDSAANAPEGRRPTATHPSPMSGMETDQTQGSRKRPDSAIVEAELRPDKRIKCGTTSLGHGEPIQPDSITRQATIKDQSSQEVTRLKNDISMTPDHNQLHIDSLERQPLESSTSSPTFIANDQEEFRDASSQSAPAQDATNVLNSLSWWVHPQVITHQPMHNIIWSDSTFDAVASEDDDDKGVTLTTSSQLPPPPETGSCDDEHLSQTDAPSVSPPRMQTNKLDNAKYIPSPPS